MGLKMKRAGTASLALLLVLGAAACGDDDDDAADVDEAASGVEAYCQASNALDELDEFPSDEQLDGLVELAPDEISEDLEFVVEKFKADGPGAFSDPEVEERFGTIEEFDVAECGAEPPDEPIEGTSTELDPDAQRVEVAALDYDFEFEAPDAGPVSFVMTNEGEEPHFMYIGRLLGGATVEEALASEDPVEEGLAEDVGESDVAGPGDEAVLTIDDLEAGDYVMACFIPTPDGTPHAFEGMAVPFTVG